MNIEYMMNIFILHYNTIFGKKINLLNFVDWVIYQIQNIVIKREKASGQRLYCL